jgi:hypothetical protein
MSMNARFVRFFVIAAALILVGGVFAQAQQASAVNIKFKFQANGRLFDAGSYTVDFGSNGNVVLTPAKGGAAIEIARTKTLGGRNIRKVELVFDRVGSLMFLSEVWIPGRGGCEVSRADTEDRETVSGSVEKTDKK